MQIDQAEFTEFHEKATSILSEALYIEGELPFTFALVERVFETNNMRLSKDLEWAFSGKTLDSKVARMRLILPEHSPSYRDLQNEKDHISYATQVVERLKAFYE